jgi:NADH-quinone oxidoreductase subunit M
MVPQPVVVAVPAEGRGAVGVLADDEPERTSAPSSSGSAHPFDDISVPERIGAALLLGTTVLIGLYPRLLLDWIVPALESPLFEKVLKGGGR